jgi:hypothetical protein
VAPHRLLAGALVVGFSIGAAREALSQEFIQVIDLLPKTRNSPLLATPEEAKLEEFTGSIGYRYPIEVPPGTGGATPSLELSYSSLTKNMNHAGFVGGSIA